MAQSGSAPGLGPGGRKFESCCPDHYLTLRFLHGGRSIWPSSLKSDLSMQSAEWADLSRAKATSRPLHAGCLSKVSPKFDRPFRRDILVVLSSIRQNHTRLERPFWSGACTPARDRASYWYSHLVLSHTKKSSRPLSKPFRHCASPFQTAIWPKHLT